VPLISFIPQPATQFGHPWKVELFSSILFLGLILFKKKFFENFRLDKISISFILFIVWSAFSAFWAESWRSVLHHTLIWSIYFVFFNYAREIVNNKNKLKNTIFGLSIFAWIINFAIIIGYTSVIADSRAESSFRTTYSKFSEILVTLLPIFIGLCLFNKRKNNVYFYGTTALFTFLAIILSLSRASFFAFALSSLIFIPFAILFFDFKTFIKRGAILSASFAICFAITQIPFSSNSSDSTLYGRATSKNVYQTSSSEVRRLLWKTGFFMAQENPLVGVGADNFGLEVNKYRAKYQSEKQTNLSDFSAEETMLERTHNEYLQILVELGVIGLGLFSAFFIFCGRSFLKSLKSKESQIYLVLKISSFIGIISFFISSFFSSFSFRAMQNGFVFFFVLALALRNKTKETNEVEQPNSVKMFKPLLVGTSILACVLLLTFTSLQIISNHQLSLAEKEKDLETALPIYQKAIEYNPDNAVAIYSIGIRYYADKKPNEAIPYMQEGIKKGLDVSITHFYLASAQRYAGFTKDAEQTIENSLKLYPRSLFLRNYHADILKQLGDNKAAENEFQIARNQDEKCAIVWNSLIENGAEETTYKIRDDKTLPAIMDLSPYNAILAISDEQHLYNPKGTNMANLFNQKQ
jgi:O-antigen ligase